MNLVSVITDIIKTLSALESHEVIVLTIATAIYYMCLLESEMLKDYFFLFFFNELKNFTQLNGFRKGFVTG
ncbi:hypothetical protein SAMN05660236_0373 [Ohtaekwangia koreensis]|uniref:Uncharacterized protein n=1 Tax=Ohtaekwangia koreensis TaxID=688867 RepID=A0A1T5IT30_9BACT|nr:hypothetical protein SAMN05660236_0373 [Ohtaekwangia koreensis]